MSSFISNLLSNVVQSPTAPPVIQQKPSLYTTSLNPQEESQFQGWIGANKIPWQDSPASDYDMRGFWKAMVSGDPNAQRAANLHFPDTWKTPYHRTFSNESIYAPKDAPQWKGAKLVDKNGNVLADESNVVPITSLSRAR